MGSTTKGMWYPDSTDHTRLWEHFKTVANEFDGQMGAFPCALADRPTAPFVGQRILDTDTWTLRMWDGTYWKCVCTVGPVIEWTPDAYSGDTLFNGSCSGRYGAYYRIGDWCWAYLQGQFNAATSGGAMMTLPLQADVRRIGVGFAGLAGGTSQPTQTGVAYMGVDIGSTSRVVITDWTQTYVNSTSTCGGYRASLVYRVKANL